ncbi:Ammonium-transport integral membrane protein Amt [Propionibacterium freudenreichii]|uniref:ammonium transporter n=1 Tax=Propionibacterium freudenreichii TaxID=1744 RepID=UPI000BC3120E|nr:ammonium transporter [Propionibacterium freudenreichii]MDK9332957.1 ammonium transporter [Propionibacterium freudenreichii]SBN59223.1 Ammonium-transport integral membrane protein Amt [Propionibacterium freudenreichii]SBN94676.1 Ammonium-transport integral membrane protein Amt [Propionibacterium freudenreichii]SCC96260.1 Ammonium-transport integral membrane protein Amt [Propionibacterium freudenreichii]SCQ47499.1 Ammonium-transport integral membrane protein Amt [Propionibacterium freudenreic
MIALEISAGDTAWVLISAALVLFMTPMLAFFYGGMVRAKGVLNMMMMSIIAMGIVGVLWVLFGFSEAFGNSWHGLIGNPFQYAGLKGLATAQFGTIPAFAFVGFQAAFAILAVALISGAVADRMRFGAWCLFAAFWSVLVYFPAAHWVFAFDGYAADKGGWIANSLKVFDFAGGTAIHINAGAAALALAIVLGTRKGFGTRPMRPHNLTLVMLGAAGLWFGWFGFNAGSALGANGTASLAWTNTLAATCAAMSAWALTERIRDGHATSLGAASGVVAGLVAITPACATVSPLGALAIGVLAGVGCCYAVGLKYKLGYDDSLDVVGVHLVGGIIGTLAVGLFCKADLTNGINGLFYGGGFEQLGRQALGAVAMFAFSFIVSSLIALVIKKTIGIRVSNEVEYGGMDISQHAEIGYDLSIIGYSSTKSVRRTIIVPPDASSLTDKPARTQEEASA